MCPRKASSVRLCVKWIRKGSVRGRLSQRVLTRSCCLKRTPVSYLTGDDVLRTRLSETWMHLCQGRGSLSAAGFFPFYAHSNILISLKSFSELRVALEVGQRAFQVDLCGLYVPPADEPGRIRARAEGTPGSGPGWINTRLSLSASCC